MLVATVLLVLWLVLKSWPTLPSLVGLVDETVLSSIVLLLLSAAIC